MGEIGTNEEQIEKPETHKYSFELTQYREHLDEINKTKNTLKEENVLLLQNNEAIKKWILKEKYEIVEQKTEDGKNVFSNLDKREFELKQRQETSEVYSHLLEINELQKTKVDNLIEKLERITGEIRYWKLVIDVLNNKRFY